ncbi:MAG: hypothetical protein V3V97_22470 [Hyphomicrobiaceae bacterium]
MRFLLGMILGALLTVAAAYIADSRSDPLQGSRMVNWTVVGEKVSDLTVDLRRIWRDFTRQITGPP